MQGWLKQQGGEMLRAALSALAVVAPEWLQNATGPEWDERYGHRVENCLLPKHAVRPLQLWGNCRYVRGLGGIISFTIC